MKPTTEYRDSIDSVTSTQPLNPSGTIHQPPPLSPAQPYRDDDGRDGDSPEREPRKVSLVQVLRLFVVVLGFVVCIIESVAGPHETGVIFITVLSWITFVWNTIAIVPNKIWNACLGRGKKHDSRMPQISLVFGSQKLLLCGARDGDDDDNNGGDHDHKRKLAGPWVIDLLLAGVTLLIALIDIRALSRWGWHVHHLAEHIKNLLFIVIALEFTIGLLAIVPALSSIHFAIRPAAYRDAGQYEYRIQLPQDVEANQAHPQPISVAA